MVSSEDSFCKFLRPLNVLIPNCMYRCDITILYSARNRTPLRDCSKENMTKFFTYLVKCHCAVIVMALLVSYLVLQGIDLSPHNLPFVGVFLPL